MKQHESEWPFFDGPMHMLATQEYIERIEEVATMYQAAFAGSPWFENLSDDDVMRRVRDHAMKPGFEAFIAKDDEGNIRGGLWYDTPGLDTLVLEQGEELGQFAQTIAADTGIHKLIWLRESIVHPEAQGRGMATRLRNDFNAHVTRTYEDGALVLARMRSDNVAVLKIAKRFGYKQTGIHVPSSMDPTAHHEYWYGIVNGPREVQS